MADAPSRTPTYVSLALVAAALIVAAVGGFSEGSIVGAILAFAAVIPAGFGMWKGMQENTQAGVGMAIGVFFLALGVAGLLIILRVIEWLR